MLRDFQSLRTSGAPSWRAQRVLHHAAKQIEAPNKEAALSIVYDKTQGLSLAEIIETMEPK